MERTELKLFRIRQGLSQEGMAKRIGYNRNTYAAIERGERDGRPRFWERIRTEFDLRESELKELKRKNDESA